MLDIVIIEDDELMRSLLVEWLTAEGHRVSAFDTSKQTMTDDADNSADLVIVAVIEPRHRGVEGLRRISRRYPAARIIAISGQFHAGLACAGPAARALGADRIIAKPFDRAALLDALHATIGFTA